MPVAADANASTLAELPLRTQGAMACTCSSTGKTRVSAATSGGSRLSTSLAGKRREMTAQVVDDAVERLERHGLVLVASAGEHDDVIAPCDLAEKAPNQRALADA